MNRASQSTLVQSVLTGVLSCKLYQLTHEQKYLDKAIECFNWLQAYMQDPSDHLYYDNVSPDPEDPTQPGRMETNKYSYNSGQPLQLACLLYKITKNESYLTAAHQIAEACHKSGLLPIIQKFCNVILIFWHRGMPGLTPSCAADSSNFIPLIRIPHIWKMCATQCCTHGLVRHITLVV